jgi:prepilin signal peptidase PulO-like enzyme (type II secretory pathway)
MSGLVLSPALVAAGIALLFGLVVGSFANVVIHRLPLEQSIVSPPLPLPPLWRRDQTLAEHSRVFVAVPARAMRELPRADLRAVPHGGGRARPRLRPDRG